MRQSNPDVSTWYRDPKDGGVRYCGVNSWGEKIDYFFAPFVANKLNSPGVVTLYNYDTGDTETLDGDAPGEDFAVVMMSEHFVRMCEEDDDGRF